MNLTLTDSISLRLTQPFSLEDTLNCGQCFRWKRQPDGSYNGVIDHTAIAVSISNKTLYCRRLSLDSTPLESLCQHFFDLDTDYQPFQELCRSHPVLSSAVDFAGGIHILRQQPWEALCSFILSQNNNIKRITGLIERLCEYFGDPIPCQDGGTFYAFPCPQQLETQTLETLAPVRSGFRAKYVIDAAQKVVSGGIPLDMLDLIPTDEAINILMQIRGVGPKVAQCALLFGWHKLDCLPRDVWINRAMESLFPNGFPDQVLPIAGIAQQYLFHYVRAHPEICAEYGGALPDKER